MKATRTAVTLCLILAAASVIGCTTTVKLNVSNESSTPLGATLSDAGDRSNNLGMLPALGQQFWDLTYKNSKLPKSVSLTVGKQTETFTVSETGPKVFRYRVGPNGKLEKRPEKLMVNDKKDVTTPVGGPKEVVTGD